MEDVIILGTSPVLLLEGLFRSRAGQKVLFLDPNPAIGGAWALIPGEVLGYGKVEAACHVMVHYRGIYDFLADRCGVPMAPSHPAPLLMRENRLTPFYSRSAVIRSSLALVWRLGRTGGSRCLEAMLRRHREPKEGFNISKCLVELHKRASVPMLRSPEHRAFRYPVGGMPAMLETIWKELDKRDCRLIHATAKRLILDPNGDVSVETSGGETLITRKLVLSESCALEEMDAPSKTRRFRTGKKDRVALIVLVQGADCRLLSYVAFPLDPLVKRVTDVTEYCECNDADPLRRVLVCEIPDSTAEQDPFSHAEKILRHLQKLAVIPAEVAAVAAAYYRLELLRGDPELPSYLDKLRSDSVLLIRSRGDMTFSLKQNRRRWERLEAGK